MLQCSTSIPVVRIALPANDVSARWFNEKLFPTDCWPIDDTTFTGYEESLKMGISNEMHGIDGHTVLYLGGHIGLENGLIPAKREVVYYLIDVCTE